jgi:hypothetical protein
MRFYSGLSMKTPPTLVDTSKTLALKEKLILASLMNLQKIFEVQYIYFGYMKLIIIMNFFKKTYQLIISFPAPDLQIIYYFIE